MKKIFRSIFVIYFIALSFAAFSQTKEKVSSYGDKINDKNAVDVKTLSKSLATKDSVSIKVKGKVIDVCQRKGCWMNVDLGNGEQMMVRFKDYGFFVPKDAGGKTVVMQGIAFKDETSVEQLRHYAQDAGKSKEEIAKITQPEKAIAFEASGVLLINE
jgi:hypothetical protein